MADQIIDITVNQIVEEVTLNVTPDIIEINVNSITNDTSKISGSGTTNYIPKFTSSGSIGNSSIAQDANGNIGLGINSPNYSTSTRRVIDINGTSQSMLSFSIGGVGKGFLFHTGTDLLVSNEGNGAIKFNTNGSQKVVIEAGGNVGIGTSSPSSKLQVVGLPEYATNALALAGGLTVGAFYHTAGILKVVI